VAQVATVGEVQTHQTAVGRHESLVNLEVGRASTEALNVDTPLGRVEVEGLESTLLAEKLNLVNVLVATVVPGTRKTLGVLVGHGRPEGVENGPGGDVLRGDEDDGLPLPLDLIFHDLGDLRVRVDQGLLEQLRVLSARRGRRAPGRTDALFGGVTLASLWPWERAYVEPLLAIVNWVFYSLRKEKMCSVSEEQVEEFCGWERRTGRDKEGQVKGTSQSRYGGGRKKSNGGATRDTAGF
jgi:hypothetical protein